jgi:hypothetical protein
MSKYLEQYSFTPPDQDKRAVALAGVAIKNGVPMHDLRAVDMVERALLDPRWDFRTAKSIEEEGINERNVLPAELILSILTTTSVIARRSVLKSPSGQDLYTHRSRSQKSKERLRMMLLAYEDFTILFDKDL